MRSDSPANSSPDRAMPSNAQPSVGALSHALVECLVTEAARYRIAVAKGPLGATLVDAGAKASGGIGTGLLIAEICMGGLGTAAVAPSGLSANWPWTVHARSTDPVLACLGSQYAGWSLSARE